MEYIAFRFLDFELLPGKQLLLYRGSRLQVGARALDLLECFARRPGEMVAKSVLMHEVWPNQIVEETNLRTLIRTLRKAIGDDEREARYIINVPRRGYRFTPEVVADASQRDRPTGLSPVTQPSHNLPMRLTSVIGRSKAVAAIDAYMREGRLVSILGPGGIGKTTVAVECALAALHRYSDGALFVDLSSLTHDKFVASTVAMVLGLPVTSVDSTDAVVAYLRGKTLLLVLDSCEPVIAGAATFAESVLRAAPGICLLATSREPLRAEGEQRYRLQALDVAPPNVRADQAHLYSALNLFRERARACSPGFELDDNNATAVADLCRRLDGLPLAIELAAARVDTLGPQGILARLNERFSLLTQGRRTALPRQQTLRATIDWSYDQLSEPSRAAFRRLGIFEGSFTLDAAEALAPEIAMGRSPIAQLLDGLTEKSLVVAEQERQATVYRLLDSSRAYAFEKLVEAGEQRDLAHRFSRYICRQLADAEIVLASGGRATWLASNSRAIKDIRALLAWAFSDIGDEALGVELTAAAVPLWWEMALLEEQGDNVAKALAAFPNCKGSLNVASSKLKMQLCNAQGFATFYTRGLAPEVKASFEQALAIAAERGDAPVQLRALWGIFGANKVAGDYSAALDCAGRYLAMRPTDGDAAAVGDRMMAMALHYGGKHAEAEHYLSKILSQPVPARPATRAVFQYDNRVTARAQHARSLWVRGFPDRAKGVAEEAVGEAARLDHELSLCFVLAFGACPVSAWRGDLFHLEAHTASLMAYAGEFSFHYWESWGRCYQAALSRRSVNAGQVAPLQQLAVTDLHLDILSSLHESFVGCAALDRTERGLNGWCAAEVLRCRGEQLAKLQTRDAETGAEQSFLKSMTLANEQGALSWELRGATSFARFAAERQRRKVGLDVLSSVYDRLTEGFTTSDAAKALELLDSLR